MGSVCSRCRRGSASSYTTNEQSDNNFTNEHISQRPQSSFSLHNIDALANDAEKKELDEKENVINKRGKGQKENLEQRTSIENENASLDNVTSEDSNISPHVVKRKSSFSEYSSNFESSSCSTSSSRKSFRNIDKEFDPDSCVSEKNNEKESSGESFVMPPKSKVSNVKTLFFKYVV